MKNELLELFTDGEVTLGERKFTRLLGGFGEGKAVFSDLQLAEMLEYADGARFVRRHVERNIKNFENGVHYINVSEEIKRESWSHTLKETLISLGYAKQSISQAKNIYLFSEAGVLLFLKFAEGDKAVEAYKNFIEDYFRTKATVKVLEKTLKEQIEFLKEQRALKLGMQFMEQDISKKMELMNESESINAQIIKLEKKMSEEELFEAVKDDVETAKLLTDEGLTYDIGTFSKVLSIDGLGRNNLFKWMQEQGILRPNNEPYQMYMKYFKVIYTAGKYSNKKVLLTGLGVKFIINRLKKDGKIIQLTFDEVFDRLNSK